MADLRPEHLKARPPTEEESQRGRELLRRAVDAQGGADAWARWTAPEVIFRDEWRGIVGRFSCPWPALKNHVRLQWRRDGSLTEAHFLDRPETWRSTDGTHDFILAAYPYLMELPFRLLDAPKVAWIGEREQYDLVLATWETFEPHAQHDQFVLWIDRESHRVVMAEYTIRDKYHWATGADHFEDFRRAGPLLLPFRHTITLRPWSDSVVHRIEIEAARSVERLAETQDGDGADH